MLEKRNGITEYKPVTLTLILSCKENCGFSVNETYIHGKTGSYNEAFISAKARISIHEAECKGPTPPSPDKSLK